MADSNLRLQLLDHFASVRGATEKLAAPLSAEDQMLQSMAECSPTKWHRAHTTWFFEEFVLAPAGIPHCDARYRYLFNSYYEAVGPRHPRPQRGLLSRPSLEEVGRYRHTVDGRVRELLASLDERELELARPMLELGLAHEEQHQELLLSDILHSFAQNPLLPVYSTDPETDPKRADRSEQVTSTVAHFDGGLSSIGHLANGHFAFDNEGPRHRVWLEPFSLATRLITVGDVRAFIEEQGYQAPSLWLAAGMDFVREHDIRAPLFARVDAGDYRVFTLRGVRSAADDEPASHLSYYEADALARFLGGRLPTEAEWEVAAAAQSTVGNFRESGLLRPAPAGANRGNLQLYGDVWEWTSSAYAPYPGYRPQPGAIGEYNGKFMVGQLVLRGGSCLTPHAHVRPTYRNFWHPHTRFQMTGARVAFSR